MVQRYKLPSGEKEKEKEKEEENEQQALRPGRCRFFPIHTNARKRCCKEGRRKNKCDSVLVILCHYGTVKRERKQRKTNTTMSLLCYVASTVKREKKRRKSYNYSTYGWGAVYPFFCYLLGKSEVGSLKCSYSVV